MQDSARFRHELKYEIAHAEYLVLRQRLRHLMRPDTHADARGRYKITSLYFDNSDDKALREKVDGVDRREKFRLRYYNGSPSVLMLEKKQKVNGLCLKSTAPFSVEACQRLLDGSPGWLPEHPHPLLTELDFKMKTQLLRPRTIVVYWREPYVYAAGNVRITFDMDIRTGLSGVDFLNPDACTVPARMDGRMILEVKYDAFLPDQIAAALQLGSPRAGAFSKYAACRQYE